MDGGLKKYDIFISYRRSSYETASLIATRLLAAGYSVFFDIESLRSGKFNEQLYEVIDGCKDFIVVLSQNALDRCVNEDDWVRLGVCRAMAARKNIVPVMLSGFEWPKPMPKGMEELCSYQALSAGSIEFFDMAMERLQKRYLYSKQHIRLGKIAKWLGACALSLLAIVAILWGVMMVLSRDVCVKYATHMVKNASDVHTIIEENQSLAKEWAVFDRTIEVERRAERVALLQEQMIQRIDLTEKNLRSVWMVDSTVLNISSYHSFLLSLNGLNAESIAMSPLVATMHYKEYLDMLEQMSCATHEPNAHNRRIINTLLELFEYSTNCYYAALLGELSLFPEYSRQAYNELSLNWTYFNAIPYEIGMSQEYYERIIKAEGEKASQAIARQRSIIQAESDRLDDIERAVETMDQEIQQKSAEIEAELNAISKAVESSAN